MVGGGEGSGGDVLQGTQGVLMARVDEGAVVA